MPWLLLLLLSAAPSYLGCGRRLRGDSPPLKEPEDDMEGLVITDWPSRYGGRELRWETFSVGRHNW